MDVMLTSFHASEIRLLCANLSETNTHKGVIDLFTYILKLYIDKILRFIFVYS